MALRDIYDELVAVADLRGGNEYVTEYVPADDGGFTEALVCAIGIVPLRETGSGDVIASLFVEFDAEGNVIQDSLDSPPQEAMGKWDGAGVKWDVVESLDELPAYINPQAHGLSSEFPPAVRARRPPS